MSKPSVPQEVVFAQKASSIVQAAGFDPKTIDLESFRQMAHIIFGKAFMSIYNELPGDYNENPQTQNEHLHNADELIMALYNCSQNENLSDVTGQDLCFGDHRTIGIIVGILYAEGQRMWLENYKAQINQQGRYDMFSALDVVRDGEAPMTTNNNKKKKDRPSSASQHARTQIGQVYAGIARST